MSGALELEQLQLFAVSWEARPRGAFTSGARQIHAFDQAAAAAACRRLVAQDNGWPIGNIKIVAVRSIDRAA